MSSSAEVVAFMGQELVSFSKISDLSPYATQITAIVVKMTGFQYTEQSPNLLQTPMPKLSSITFGIFPGGPPHTELIFEYSLEQFPALMALSLGGVGLRCTSLGNLQNLELRNFPEQSPTVTLNGLLDLLESSTCLKRLTLDNYLSMAFNDQPSRALLLTMRALRELCVRDTPQQTARLLRYLRQLPPNTTIGGLFGDTRFERLPKNVNVFLDMLPHGRVDLTYPVLTDTTTAKLKLSEDAVQLVCRGRQGVLTLEVHSTLRLGPETPPAIYTASYSAAVAAAGAILGVARALDTLEFTGTPIGLEHRALVDVFHGTVGLRQLTIVDPGPGHMARGLLEAIASGPEGDQPGLQAHRVLCPHLEALALRQTTYTPAVVNLVLQAMQHRDRVGGRLRRLELALQVQAIPAGRDRYGQPTYDIFGASHKGWENQLLAHVETVQITDL